MSELTPADPEPEQPRMPRWGAIELLQVLSVLALAAAYFLRNDSRALAVAVVVGVILFAAPFLLVRLPSPKPEPEPRRLPEGPRGFKVTRERRRILAELSVPPDILAAIDDEMLGVYYKSGEEMREWLYFLLGKARVRPFLDTILLHAKVYESPETPNEQSPSQAAAAAPLAGDDPQLTTGPGLAAPTAAAPLPSATVTL